MTSQFSFLQQEYLELYKLRELAEKLYFIDPSSSIAKSRLFSEKLAVLHKAFKGELTQQLDSDGDARELLREIELLHKTQQNKGEKPTKNLLPKPQNPMQKEMRCWEWWRRSKKYL